MSRDVAPFRRSGVSLAPALVKGTPLVPPSGDRLDSWKEIARYLNRDVRTLHRWEGQEELPVHRHLHNKRSTVWAFKGELVRRLKLPN